MKRSINNFFIPILITGLGLIVANRTIAQTFTTLHSFSHADGAFPLAGLILSGNTMYGTANVGGTNSSGAVFAINTDGTGFTNLYTFTPAPFFAYANSDGAFPKAGLVLSGNTLYGTTDGGGTNGIGVVFTVKTDGTDFTNLHTFAGGDGVQPDAGLLLSGNTLYGTASGGGTNNNGTIFAVNTDGTGFTNMHTFSATVYNGSFFVNSDGANPLAGLVLSGNTLYGTTRIGGTNGNGTVFAINTDGTGFTDVHSFTGSNGGGAPVAGLILSGNSLYGTTAGGGTNDNGTVFAINTDGTDFTNLHSFTGNDGANPEAGLILSRNTLYGTTSYGGTNGAGTVFAINTDGTGFATLYSFTAGSTSVTNRDGANPQAGLTLYGNALYGTAQGGGTNGWGTVFSLSLPQPLQLSITLSGTNVVLTWPTNFTGYTLQSTPTLAPPVFWNTVSGQFAVTNPISGTQMFYRLSQ
jgi:uncharacterized repeat protein (TIGR03803 family)